MIDDMAVYIANLGKYNEGYLVGAWFTFPIDEEDVKEKIGLNEQYEEYAIHDTDNCLRPLYDEYGNVYIVVDMELKGLIREALIKMILDFDIPLETEE